MASACSAPTVARWGVAATSNHNAEVSSATKTEPIFASLRPPKAGQRLAPLHKRLASSASSGCSQAPLWGKARQLQTLGVGRGETRMQATATNTSFHIGETTITVPLTVEVARDLNDGLSSILQTFKDKEQATRPKRWESLDWKHKGDLAAGGIHLEVFCNPNAYGNAFQAKVLITAKDDRMQVTAEGQLSALKADVTTFIESQ